VLSLADDVAEIEMKLEDTHLNSATALPPCLEMGRKLHQENSSLYQQIPKENHQKSSRTQKRLFSRNESVNVDKHVETSLLHFSVDDSLGLEVTGNYVIFLSHLCIIAGYFSRKIKLAY
jgi:hypothetical protein